MKYLLSIVLFFASGMIFLSIERTNLDTDMEFEMIDLSLLNIDINERQGKILPVFIFEITNCQPCIYNTVEYLNLIDNKKEDFTDAIFVFIEEKTDLGNLEKYERFLMVRDINEKFIVLDKEEPLSSFITKNMQDIILVNSKSGLILSKVHIPDFYINREAKLASLTNAVKINNKHS